MTDSIAQIETDMVQLDTSQGTEALVLLHGRIGVLAARLRAMKAEVEAVAIQHIEATGEPIELPAGNRWYVGTTTTWHAVDDAQVVQALLSVSGGTLDCLRSGEAGCLSAHPWKVGAIRRTLGDEAFSELFRSEVEIDLKTSQPRKALKSTMPGGHL